MRRIEALGAAVLDDRQERLRAAIVSSRGSVAGPDAWADDLGRLPPPFAAMLWNPEVGDALQALGAALRSQTRLDARLVELAVIRVAAVCGSGIERTAHRRIAAGLGLDDAAIDGAERGVVGSTVDVDLQEAAEAVLLAVDWVLDVRPLDDGDVARLDRVLGAQGLFEVSTLVGYYWLLARQMRVFGEEG